MSSSPGAALPAPLTETPTAAEAKRLFAQLVGAHRLIANLKRDNERLQQQAAAAAAGGIEPPDVAVLRRELAEMKNIAAETESEASQLRDETRILRSRLDAKQAEVDSARRALLNVGPTVSPSPAPSATPRGSVSSFRISMGDGAVTPRQAAVAAAADDSSRSSSRSPQPAPPAPAGANPRRHEDPFGTAHSAPVLRSGPGPATAPSATLASHPSSSPASAGASERRGSSAVAAKATKTKMSFSISAGGGITPRPAA